MKDQTIIDLLLKKDEKGMEILLQQYGPMMRYIIAPILQNPDDREDCLSEVTMRVWEKAEQFHGERGSFHTWLTAVTRNTALNYKRDNCKHDNCKHDTSGEVPEDIPSQEPGPEDMVLQKERQAALERALGQLSKEERTLFYRKYYYMQPAAQIASEMGISKRAVDGKLYRLKNRLRKLLGGEAHE